MKGESYDKRYLTFTFELSPSNYFLIPNRNSISDFTNSKIDLTLLIRILLFFRLNNYLNDAISPMSTAILLSVRQYAALLSPFASLIYRL